MQLTCVSRRPGGNMLSMFLQRRINHDLAKLTEAERSGNAQSIQEAYENLFVLCRENHLDLHALLREPLKRSGDKVA
jgi:hypothetical protein